MRYVSVVLLLAVTFASCSPSLYFPDRVNTPGFTNKGQALLTTSFKPQVSATDSTKPKSKGGCLNLDAGYAISDHFAILGSYRDLNDRYVSEKGWAKFSNSVGGIFDGRRYEIAAGYFSGKHNGFMADVYGGIGSGYIHRSAYYTPKYNFKTNYTSYFIQGSIGGNWDFFRISTGMKIAVYDYRHFNAPASADLQYTIAEGRDNTRKDVNSQLFTFATQYMDMELGYKFIMFNLQQGLSEQFSGGRLYSFPYYMTLGISLRLDPQLWSNNSTHTTTHE